MAIPDSTSLCRFTPNSSLELAIRMRFPNFHVVFQFKYVLLAALYIILPCKLIDIDNSFVLILNTEVIRIFKAMAIHISQLPYYVSKHVSELTNEEKTLRKRTKPPGIESYISGLPEVKFEIPKIKLDRYWDILNFEKFYKKLKPINCIRNDDAYYTLSKPLRKVFMTVPIFFPQCEIFKYSTICSLLSRYIIDNAAELIDEGNCEILIIYNTPLSKAFKQRLVHFSQIHACLALNIKPFNKK